MSANKFALAHKDEKKTIENGDGEIHFNHLNYDIAQHCFPLSTMRSLKLPVEWLQV